MFLRSVVRRQCGHRYIHFKNSNAGTVHYLGLGVLSGFAGSLVGMGGAFIALPFMTGYFNMSQNLAHGTSMAVVLATSFGASVSYAQRPPDVTESSSSTQQTERFMGVPEVVGSVHVLNAICLAATSSIMVIFGAKLSKRLPAKYLKLAHGFLMLVVGPMIPFQDYLKNYMSDKKSLLDQSNAKNMIKICDASRVGVVTEDENIATLKSLNTQSNLSHVIRPMAVGIFSGTLAGIFGVGGGVVMVPALCFFTDMDYQTSLGTSLAAMLPTAVVGCITQHLQRQMVLKVGIPLGVGCLVGSYVGGQFGTRIADDKLKYGFAAVMVTIGTRTIIQALKLIRKL